MVANYVSTVARQVGCSISARHFNHVKRVAKKCMLASGIRIGGARVSPTLGSFRRYRPVVENSHMTSSAWPDPLGVAQREVGSMDGKGRCLDNVFVERLWRTVKHDEIYLRSYADLTKATTHLTTFFRFYNDRRPHSAHDRPDGQHFTPMEVYRRDLAQPLSA